MEQRNQITAKIIGRDRYLALISTHSVYEFKENEPKQLKKILALSKKTSVKISKTEILGNGLYKFTIKIYEDPAILDLIIEGNDGLQKFFQIMGQLCYINGLQQILIIFKKIGEGSFAQVYEAVTNYQHKMALKLFQKKSFEGNEKGKKSFLNQIDMLKRLSCKHIVTFDYVFETQRAYYLKMEHFQHTLKQKIAIKTSIKTQKQIMKQLLIALAELKAKNIIHRDLKPDNIMIRVNEKGQQEYVIIDFGLATLADAQPYLFFRCGTPGFLAPEIANLSNKKEKQTPAADMFSLAAIFYKIITSRHIFNGKNAKVVLEMNRKCEIKDGIFDDLSLKEKDLLKKMLEVNPLLRISPAEALKHCYFDEDIDDNDEIAEEECYIQKNLKKIANSFQIKNMEFVYNSVESLMEQSLHSYTHNGHKNSLKDSCCTFQMGFKEKSSKENSEDSRLRSTKMATRMKRQSRFSKIGQNISNVI